LVLEEGCSSPTQQGHDVSTPTLTGLGDRSHLLTQDIDLDTHIQDVEALLNYEDLSDVILVGHSYGGMVITGVADEAPMKLARLVYLDATAPTVGESLLSMNPPAFRDAVLEASEIDGDGWRVPPFSLSTMGVYDPEDVAWVEPKLRDHPLASIRQPLQFHRSTIETIPRSYVRCKEGAPNVNETAARMRANKDGDYVEIESGHDAMVTVPIELAEALVSQI